jgi:peptide methionine sulfoxide reductase msrA/msrB
VFRGEGFTGKGTRHCVNSLSLAFESAGSGTAAGPGTGTAREAARAPDEVTLAGTCAPGDPAPAAAPATQDAYFAGGCFWGVEYYLDKAPGVLKAESGYMGGHKADPSYREVCDGDTGHVETVHVVFDPSKTSYEALAKLFFEIHDPTQVDRQGPDVGEQYRSVVYVTNDAQRAVIRGLLDRLRLRGLAVATRIEPAGTFWPAEAYHQDYYDHKGGKPYCHARVERFGAE